MKFDKILMNPPYCGSLHLKILREAMKNGKETVNLSPIRWLQDPLIDYKSSADYKRFSDIRKHIISIDVINVLDASRLFNAAFRANLGIYHIDSGFHNFEYKRDPFIEKMLNKFSEGKRFSYNNDTVGDYEIVLPAVHGHPGQSDWAEITSKDWDTAVNVKAGSAANANVIMRFSTEDERLNFYNSLFTKFYKFFIYKLKTNLTASSYIKFLPIMPDYTHPWTDEMLYDYFNLTEEERRQIECSIKS